MSRPKQISIGFATEGVTDQRFLDGIIQRTFEQAALESDGTFDILRVQHLPKQMGSFIETVVIYAKEAAESGLMVLCVQIDADDETAETAYQTKIDPAFSAVQAEPDGTVCKQLIAIVPVQMTESWLLADKNLLKSEIGTEMSDFDLGIHKLPETYADPKQVIKNALQIAQREVRRRRPPLSISGLYAPLGQKIPLAALQNVPSYRAFWTAVQDIFIKNF